jgi:hypothetical protein
VTTLSQIVTVSIPNTNNQEQEKNAQAQIEQDFDAKKVHEYSPEFLHLWDLYPRGSEKVIAEKCCLARINEGFIWDELESAARRYSAAVLGTEKKYIKLAKTFFGVNRPFEEWITGIPDGERNRDTAAAEKRAAERSMREYEEA